MYRFKKSSDAVSQKAPSVALWLEQLRQDQEAVQHSFQCNMHLMAKVFGDGSTIAAEDVLSCMRDMHRLTTDLTVWNLHITQTLRAIHLQIDNGR